MEIIPNQMSSRHKLMVFLVAAVSFLANNLTTFLVFESFIEGFILIASTDDILSLSLFSYSSSSFYFMLDAWTVGTWEILGLKLS